MKPGEVISALFLISGFGLCITGSENTSFLELNCFSNCFTKLCGLGYQK